ncbi:hypothetical protein BU17DRAFT_42394 [Hysterangium stoloniferum]|nr:hypothetical protein BU17DRAFT_42394 [Hysterangium stoloniferum]
MSGYTGSLQTKKKSELQDIAIALEIADTGTREEIQTRIKLHLAQNEGDLSEDPKFAGLYGRNRKRSVQPQTVALKDDNISMSSEDHEERIRTTTRRPFRPTLLHENNSMVKVLEELEPADVPLPASPMPSAVIQAAASAIGRDANSFVQKMRQQERTISLEGRRLLKNTQNFLSNASNIYTITLIFELTLMFWTIVPFAVYSVERESGVLSISYPKLSYFRSAEPWKLLARWSLPTLVVPQLCGALISFNTSRGDIDPVTVGIMRVACSVAHKWGIQNDVLDSRWRILSASVGAAFAFAEAIGAKKQSQIVAPPAAGEEAT